MTNRKLMRVIRESRGKKGEHVGSGLSCFFESIILLSFVVFFALVSISGAEILDNSIGTTTVIENALSGEGFAPYPSIEQSKNVAKKDPSPLEKILDGAEEADYEILISIYDLNVFDYFNLNADYDTDLKKKVFKKTQEYTEKINQLKKIRSAAKDKTYYLKLAGARSAGYYRGFYYNIKRKGFEIVINNDGRSQRCMDNYFFPLLPIRNLAVSTPERIDEVSDVLFLAMNEEQGLNIENAKTSASLYVVFEISGITTVKAPRNSIAYCLEETIGYHPRYLQAMSVRVVFANDASGDVYFNKKYN